MGIGLSDAKDISVKGLEIVKKCSFVYLESYTSKLSCSVSSLEELYGKKVILADREMVESKADEILFRAKDKDVALLVIGDVFSATTHIDLMLRAKKASVKVKVVHNASIISAVGITGLEVYKFGKVTSIPFENKNVKSPIEVFKKNFSNDIHTLFLLDLDPKKDKFMTINEAIDYLVGNGVDENLLGVACANIGGDAIIKAGSLKELKEIKISKYPQCLIIPSKKLHFMEEEALEMYR